MTTFNFKNLCSDCTTADDVRNAFNHCNYINIQEESQTGDNVAAQYFGADDVNSSELGQFDIALDNGATVICDGQESPCTEDCRVTIFENEYEGETLYTYTIHTYVTGERI